MTVRRSGSFLQVNDFRFLTPNAAVNLPIQHGTRKFIDMRTLLICSGGNRHGVVTPMTLAQQGNTVFHDILSLGTGVVSGIGGVVSTPVAYRSSERTRTAADVTAPASKSLILKYFSSASE